ncbi:hypothetical protein H6B11_17655 [Mediterraneibacter glycyrrhizinilyticus]|nr:hypothetical protein [Mediterraneibacter glycyrrhizinilyticus]MBM6855920.1 hypothetical protein [Mediterraneibacter glycyrrhizinilyticus]
MSDEPRLILTSLSLLFSSISPFTPKYDLRPILYELYGYLYERSTPYNNIEVMFSEQSAGSICMEGAVRTEAAASDAKAVG